MIKTKIARTPKTTAIQIAINAWVYELVVILPLLSVAASIATKAPMTIYGCKKMILHSRDNTIEQTLDYVGLWNASFFSKDEITKSMQANQEKRLAEFTPLPPKPPMSADTEIVLP